MFDVDPKTKKSKLAILQEIMELMDEVGVSERLKSKKKPEAVEVSVSSVDSLPDAENLEARLAEKAGKEPSVEEEDDDEDSDLKEQLMEMYSKLK